jgi:hypothetical protein
MVLCAVAGARPARVLASSADSRRKQKAKRPARESHRIILSFCERAQDERFVSEEKFQQEYSTQNG